MASDRHCGISSQVFKKKGEVLQPFLERMCIIPTRGPKIEQLLQGDSG